MEQLETQEITRWSPEGIRDLFKFLGAAETIQLQAATMMTCCLGVPEVILFGVGVETISFLWMLQTLQQAS